MLRPGRLVVTSLLVIAVGFGCGDGGGERRPDTGAGANQPVPTALNCSDFCARLGDCVVTLCNEDTKSNQYDGFGGLLAAQCESTCTDSLLMSGFTPQIWQCLFQSSCRQVFDYDTCNSDGSYYCN
jgi:hypothetical protein